MTQKHNALLATAKSRAAHNPHKAPAMRHLIGGAIVTALAVYLATIVLFSI